MSIGVNLRVTGHTSIGGRKYQEDYFSVAYQQTENDQNLEYAYFGIYDGHGGAEASLFAKEHLMNTIVSQKLFWSENDDDVLKSIREGYVQTHYSMWREQDKWPKTSSGLPSTAGTTASIAFIRRGKLYIGHVGDSGIVLGFQNDRESGHDGRWVAMPLTEDHKPESYTEKMRIMNCGGKVVSKSGVPRVVWNRPRIGHKGPVRRSTPIDEIPFLAVARSLGDLWSYNSAMDEFIVSPVPDVSVYEIDPKKYRCLIFGTDGLWNVMSAKNAVEIVRNAEMENIRIALEGGREWKNPSKLLVNEALERWSRSNMKADNTSVVIIMLDPPGPPKRDVLKSVKNTIQHVASEQCSAGPSTAGSNIIDLFDCITRGEPFPTVPVVGARREPQEIGSLRYHGPHQQLHQQQKQHPHHNYHSLSLNSEVYTVTEPQEDDHNDPHQQQQPHPMEHHQPDPYIQTDPSTSYHQDLSYSDSFAESYNSLLDRSFENTDHSYTTIFHPIGEHGSDAEEVTESYQNKATMVESEEEDEVMFDYLSVSDDETTNGPQMRDSTYSLTNLQTKSERLRAEMLEPCNSPDTYYHRQSTAENSAGYGARNLSIIEHFHNYHTVQYDDQSQMSHPDDTMDTGEASNRIESIGGAMRSLVHHNYQQQQSPPYQLDVGSQYNQHHSDFHSQSHDFHHPAAFQMERYDYRQTVNNNGSIGPCEATCSKDPSSRGKGRQYFADDHGEHEEPSEELPEHMNEEDAREALNDDHQNVICIHGHRIQINEVSSSYGSPSRSATVVVSGSDRRECLSSGTGSGDEENSASSTTSHCSSEAASVKQVVVPVLLKPRSKKSGPPTRVMTIFYETRSSRRRPRNRNLAASCPDGSGNGRTELKSAAFNRITKRRNTPAMVRATVTAASSTDERVVTIERRILRSNGVMNTAKQPLASPVGNRVTVGSGRTAVVPSRTQGLLVNGFGVTTTTPTRSLTLHKLRVGTNEATRLTRREEQRPQSSGKIITRQQEVVANTSLQRTRYLRRAQ